MEMSIVAERLVVIRKKAELTQAEFAKKVGLSARGYRNYEWAVRELPLSVVLKICEVFKVDLRWLVLGEGTLNSASPDLAIEKIIVALNRLKDDNNIDWPLEKEISIFQYLFEKLTSGELNSEEEIMKYLKTTI